MKTIEDLKQNWKDLLMSYLIGVGIYSAVMVMVGISPGVTGLIGCAVGVVAFRVFKK